MEKKIELPKGKSWQSYVSFLLQSCPVEVKRTYRKQMKIVKRQWEDNGLHFENKLVRNEFYKGMATTIIRDEHTNKYLDFTLAKEEISRD